MPRIPGVNHLDAVRVLEKVGFRIARQGKHIVMTNGQRIAGMCGLEANSGALQPIEELVWSWTG